MKERMDRKRMRRIEKNEDEVEGEEEEKEEEEEEEYEVKRGKSYSEKCGGESGFKKEKRGGLVKAI